MRLLDLFCGGGGCSVGYARAGFEVVGVDVAPMPAYPFLEIHMGDALHFLADRDFLADFDVIHASPPCKLYTSMRTRSARDPEHLRRKYDARLLEETRRLLVASGKPYVIENVVGAPMHDPLTLCGSMFGLGFEGRVLKRHRLFESNVPLTAPAPDACAGRPVVGVYGTGGAWTRIAPGGGGVKVSGADAAVALGIDWTADQAVLSQAIPPVYTEHIGHALRQHLDVAAAPVSADSTCALREAIVATLEELDADEDRCGCRCCDADAVMPLVTEYVRTHFESESRTA